MPLVNGIEAARHIKQKVPRVKLVFVTMNEDTGLAADAFRAGASAYLLKQSATSELLTAIRQVIAGHAYVTPLITEGAVGALIHSDESAGNHELTPRQREARRSPRPWRGATRSGAARIWASLRHDVPVSQ